jgi:hypothetical protein
MILNIALLSVVILNQTSMNICSSRSLINTEYLVDFTIHEVEDNYVEDNLAIDNNTSFHPLLKQSLLRSLCLNAISGISLTVWQPPE